MEFVGWGVKKECPEGGTLLGMVLEYDAPSGRFNIAYANGETEKLDWPGLSSILVEASARLPSGFLEGSSPCILGNGKDITDSVDASVLVKAGGHVRPIGINLNDGFGLDSGVSLGDKLVHCGVKLIGLDLNRGMSVELDEALSLSKGETGGCLRVEEEKIDLNMDARNFKDDEDAPCFDLNFQLHEDELRNMDGYLQNLGANLTDSVKCNPERLCKDEFKQGLISEDEEMINVETMGKTEDEKPKNHTPPLVSENLTPICILEKANGTNMICSSGDNPELAAPELLKVEFESGSLKLESEIKKDSISGEFQIELSEHAPKGRRGRKRKMLEHLTSVETSATGLRRSSRRAKIAALSATSDISSGMELVNPGNQAFSPAISDISDERVTMTAIEGSPSSDVIPHKVELPHSSLLDLDGSLVFDVFYVYSFLRSFSNILFLSPFTLEAFVASIKCDKSTLLFDSIHLSLLRALKKHLETLIDDGLTSASECFRSLNWEFLDLITWPMFLLQYALFHSAWYTPGLIRSQHNLFQNDYYQLPASKKVEILRHICDDLSEGEAFRSEINRREWEMEQLNDLERPSKYESSRKRKAAVDFTSSSCLTEENLVEAADLNADECHLCKMDGVLICCDGCPAAFHPRCVGVASSHLPEGLWYCPECVIEKDAKEWVTGKSIPSIRVGNSIRGEVLGRDRCGRLYHAICGYLIVLESLNDEYSSTHYAIRLYSRDDLPKLFVVMDSSPFLYEKIKSVICQRWNICYGGGGGTENDIKTASNSIQSPFFQKKTSDTIPAHSGTVEPEIQNDPPRIMPAIIEDEFSHICRGRDYVNHYEFSQTAFSCFRELASLLSNKSSYDNPLSAAEILSKQLKTVTNRFTEFSWSNGRLSNSRTRKERCGWCFYCRAPENGIDCLFILKSDAPSLADSSLQFSRILDRDSRNSQLSDVICYILCLEGCLHGLLLGPWLSPHYSMIWRNTLLEADVSALKSMLLKLESNLHHLALSAEWNKHTDSQATVGSACHVVCSSMRLSSKNSNCWKRAKSSDAGVRHIPLNTATGLSLFWWRGGRGSRVLFSWKVLPRSLARKAARQGGYKKIAGIHYPENGEYAKRTKCVSWRAAVETSRRVDHLALQVRELDANIRWDDICNNTRLLKIESNSKKSSKSFKKVIIRKKFSKGSSTKYLLDFGKRRALPDVVTKFGSLDDSKTLKKKYWLEESYVPLYLIKAFEERRIARKAIKYNHDDPSLDKKPRERKGFEYLFSKLAAYDLPTCGHCHENVYDGEEVICKQCKGTFHKRHARWSSGATSGHCKYICRACEVSLSKIKKRHTTSQVKNLTKGPKPIRLRKFKRKRRGKQLMNSASAKRAFVVPLRRSARFAEPAPKLSLDFRKVKRKRRPPKPGKVTPKTPTIRFTKRRSALCCSSYWINGLRLSRRPNDGNFSQLRERMSLVLSHPAKFNADKPRCSICCELEYNPSLNYVSCTTCGAWFHGDALGLTEEKIEYVIDFRCHVCLQKSSPNCPHLC